MFCKSCGKEVDNSTKYCKYCGAAVSQTAVANGINSGGPPVSEENKVAVTLPDVQQMFSSKINVGTIFGCISGLLLFFGAFFSWLTARISIFGMSTSYSAPGIKMSYGIWVIITGVLSVILSFIISKKNRAFGFLILGIISVIDILVFIINFNNEVSAVTGYSSILGGINVSKGIGLWFSLLGAIVVIILGIVELRRSSTVAVPATDSPAETKPKLD